ncbi:MAG: ATP-binding protein [Clostridia bacterium]|nr:ATP-binding protein [Clostridia bacterium]
MSVLVDKKEYRRRIIDKTIETYLEVSGAICIEGPKWCGKTWTSAYHSNSEFLVGDPANNFSNRQLAELNPSLILQGETPRLIDEWQEVPAIWDATRAEVDRRHQKGQIILTGSSTPKTKGIMHSGAGRIVRLRMRTMSLYESGDSSGKVSLEELCNGNLTMQMLEEVELERIASIIVRGGWPENITVNDKKAHLMPRAYMETVIDEDLNNLDDGVEYNKHKAQLLLRSLARNESTTASDSALLKDIIEQDSESMSRNTIAKYLEALNRLFLFNNQLPFSPNLRSSLRVKQAEKRHFSDPAMACALLNITADKLLADLNTFGFLFEAMVERDLAIYAESFGAKIFHYQDYKNNEIDAVIELEDGEWCAFEIKLGAKKIDEGAENLISVCKDIVDNGGKAPKIMCVICGLSNAAYQRPDGVYVVPITALKN